MNKITVKPSLNTGCMLVIPLTELFGRNKTAFKLAELLDYSVVDMLKATVGLADGILGHCDLPINTAREYVDYSSTHLDNHRLVHLLTVEVNAAAQRLMRYTPVATTSLMYVRTTHQCVYLYVTVHELET
jgi:hypothetical protein